MVQPRGVVRSTFILTGGRALGYTLSFVRNLILARLLAKADYGLASIFGMAVALLEVSGGMALGMQVIQSKEGDTPAFMGSAQAFQFLGGCCSAVLLVAVSFPMASLLDMPQIWWAFATLAVIPLTQGLSHLDTARRQRDLDYLPTILVDIVPQILITAAAWPLTLWLKDYRVILCLMVSKAVLSCSMSFILAERPYRWAWNPAYLRRMFTFGWPLLLSGLVMLASQQADQMLVGTLFSLSMLANYALANSLVNIPWYIFSQAGGSLMLPLMARKQDQPEQFRRIYRICVQTAAVVGVICTLPLIVAGEQLVTVLFGAKYHGTGVFVALMGVATALRFLRFAPAYAAAARADTINQLYSYIWRGTSIPVALAVIAAGGTPVQIAACAAVGESLALGYSLSRLWKRQGIPVGDSLSASLYLLGLIGAGVVFALLVGPSLGTVMAVLAAILAVLVSLVATRTAFPDSYRFLVDALLKKTVAASDRTPA